jgi:hypothetical protein
MAFDTTFNILWNQRVNKEEGSYLKFLDKRKQDEDAKKRESKRASRRAMSDADLMSAVKSVRSDASASLSRSQSEARRVRSRGSAASSSVLKNAGSSVSSPTARRKAAGMTFEQQQEHVFNAQMNKYIKDLENEAKEAAVENQWTSQKIKDGMQQQVDEKSKARLLAAENQRQLQEQIEENKQRRATTRKQFVEAASAHNFPLFTETFISQEEVDQYRKDVKVDYRKELELQHKTTQTLRNVIMKKDRLHAVDKLASNIKNMQDDHANVHKETIRKGQEMMRVWDRDIRLKNIKNAILSGKDATGMQVA